MNIGGFIPNSLVDYPEKIACVVFTKGCNFHCPYCHNPDLVPRMPPPSDSEAADRVIDFLTRRRGLVDALVVSGGEPTLQTGLVSFLSRAKQLGYLVKLDTNGSRPQALRSLLAEGLVDFVAMDIKAALVDYRPHITTECDPARLSDSIRVIMESAPDYEFRTTCVRPFVSPEGFDRLIEPIRGARRYTLQRFRPGTTLDPDFFKGGDPGLTPDDMASLAALARPWINDCRIR
ncbi:anaerobic ribonucleoside-triphosphate reductase activating protein [Desulfatiferula olefinivorans]